LAISSLSFITFGEGRSFAACVRREKEGSENIEICTTHGMKIGRREKKPVCLPLSLWDI
jgi:hypothetical protein